MFPPERLPEPREATLLRGPDGATFRFDPGAPCLLLAVTGGEGEREVYETLLAPADLRHWMLRTFGLHVADVDAAALGAAKELREAVWQCANACARGERLPRAWVRVLNRAAEVPTPVPRITGSGERTTARPAGCAEVLSVLARDAIDLVTGPRAERIRRCAGEHCSLVFVDTSRPGRRRWCSMQRCGNRAKVRSFRTRGDGPRPD